MAIVNLGNDFRMKGSILIQYIYPMVLSAFFLGSTLLYNPFDIQGYYSFGTFAYEFHLVMLSCIILVSSLIMRSILYAILLKIKLKWWHYGAWVTLEGFIMSLFIALYTILFKGYGNGYFSILPTCIKFVFMTLCYPYMYLIFVRIVKIKDEEITRRTFPEDDSLVKFYDEHKRLKLSIAPSAIIYIKAEFNYVNIYYLESGKIKEFMLRASMKSLESNDNSRCIVRCQRSYFVNPQHVSVLRKDSRGTIFAEMNIQGIPPVPVSKQYYDSLSELL